MYVGTFCLHKVEGRRRLVQEDGCGSFDVLDPLLIDAQIMHVWFFIDVVFWTLLANSTTPLDIYNIHLHGPANAVVLLVEIFISATPSCWANMISSACVFLLKKTLLGVPLFQ